MFYLYMMIFLLIFMVSRNKKKPFAVFITLSLLAMLMAGNTNNPDYHSYEYWYYNNIQATNDYLFHLFSSAMMRLNLSYEIFRAIISIVGLLLIHKSLKKIHGDTIYFWFLYLLYPFMMDIVQIRNFIGFTIFFYSITKLVENKRFSKVAYLVLTLIASSFQGLFILYLPLPFILSLKENRHIRKLITLSMITIFIASIFFSSQFSFLTEWLIGNFQEYDTRVNVYLSKNYEFVKQLFFLGLNFLVIYYIKKQMDRFSTPEFSSKYEVQSKFIEVVYWLNIFICIYSPLIIVNSGFSRLFRNVIPLNYLAGIVVIDKAPKNSYRRIMTIIVILLYSLFNFLIRIYKDYYPSIFRPIFEDNFIFNIFGL